MRNYKVIVAYRGTSYYGWQTQPKHRTVQGEITKVLNRYLKEPVIIHASGRTDQGVHALGQVFSFQGELTLPTERAVKVLNRQLPDDIVLLSIEEVSLEYHARYSAKGKKYRYRIYQDALKDPLKSGLEWHYIYPLDVDRMREAAKLFLGKHDFKNFRATGSSAKTTIREIYSFDIYQNGKELVFETSGNGFLYNMVRIMVGALLEVGQGRENLAYIENALVGDVDQRVPKTAPPDGLYLVEVFY